MSASTSIETPESRSGASTPARLRDFNRRFNAIVIPACGALSLVLAGHGLATKFGVFELAGVAIAMTLAIAAKIDAEGQTAIRLVVLVAVTGVMLVVMDVLVLIALDSAVRPPPLRGFYAADAEIGFKLAPNASLVYQDRVVGSARYTINALGHRDAMPREVGPNRVLLLGDSMTFGELLDDDETIDRAIETFSDARFDAYNLGVPGYGAEATAVTLERTTLPAESAIYFFYPNDLRNDGLATGRSRVWKGFLVTGEDATGRDFSDEELDARVARGLSNPPIWLDTLRLRHLLRAVAVARRSQTAVGFQELPLDDPGPTGYREENVAPVVEQTRRMHALAAERGLDFAVMPLPSMAEAMAGQRYALVDEYLTQLNAAGIEVIDGYGAFDTDDYFAHDGHFDPSGAQKTAQIVIDWLDRRAVMKTAIKSD